MKAKNNEKESFDLIDSIHSSYNSNRICKLMESLISNVFRKVSITLTSEIKILTRKTMNINQR